LDLYEAAYGRAHYEKYSKLSRSLPQIIKSRNKLPPFAHQPYHDMESVFWILVWELSQALPSPASGNHQCQQPTLEEEVAFAEVFESLQHHQFRGPKDSRYWLLSQDAEEWQATLHPGCQSVAPLLASMAEYVNIEWAHWPQLPFDYAHEAFKRLLLREIVRLQDSGDDIALQRERRKVLPENRLRELTLSEPRSSKRQRLDPGGLKEL